MRYLNIQSLNRQARAAQQHVEFVPGCTGKRGYSVRNKATGRAGYWSVYRCTHCRLFHRTTPNRKAS